MCIYIYVYIYILHTYIQREMGEIETENDRKACAIRTKAALLYIDNAGFA